MVRVGTLPMRLLVRHYGCRMVYSEELIDKKIAKLSRYVDVETGLIHFGIGNAKSSSAAAATPTVGSDKCPWDMSNSVLTTFPGERLVVQLGTASGAEAVRAAEVVARDARAIDVNMGCPKQFSLQAGMGSALLGKPEAVRDIITSLRRNINVPITAKIRMLPETRQTLQLCQILEQCGVAAIAVHARWTPDRPRHKALPEEQVFDVCSPSIFSYCSTLS
jgi:tRNA-dihydrouridine synthase 2